MPTTTAGAAAAALAVRSDRLVRASPLHASTSPKIATTTPSTGGNKKGTMATYPSSAPVSRSKTDMRPNKTGIDQPNNGSRATSFARATETRNTVSRSPATMPKEMRRCTRPTPPHDSERATSGPTPLAVLAQRLGRVFASATTWRRLVQRARSSTTSRDASSPCASQVPSTRKHAGHTPGGERD